MTKVVITLPEDLLCRIDDEVRAHGGARSQFFVEAARRHLDRPTFDALNLALDRGREALSDAGPFESTDAIREQRDKHTTVDQMR